VPKSRDLKDGDEERIKLIEQEIEQASANRKTSTVATSTAEDEAERNKKARQMDMLARRLTDHNFMNFIKRTGLYGSKKTSGKDASKGDKWKRDKVQRAAEDSSGGSSEHGPLRGLRGRGLQRSSSDSSLSSHVRVTGVRDIIHRSCCSCSGTRRRCAAVGHSPVLP